MKTLNILLIAAGLIFSSSAMASYNSAVCNGVKKHPGFTKSDLDKISFLTREEKPKQQPKAKKRKHVSQGKSA